MDNKQQFQAWIAFIWIFSQGILVEPNEDVVCGNAAQYFENCKRNISSDMNKTAVMEFTSIPLNKDQIRDYCKFFGHGLRCYNDYLNKCIKSDPKRNVIEGEVLPAKNFYEMICKDDAFRKDYLSHKDCFRHIEKDWSECIRRYQHIVYQEFTRTERERKSNLDVQQMNVCCAQHGYKECVYTSAKFKCKAHSAQFAKGLVELLSNEQQFQVCEHYGNSICAKAVIAEANFFKVCFALLALKMIFVNFFSHLPLYF